MVTIVRTGSLRIVIWPDDHEPPHVHVFGDGETKILLGATPEALEVVFSIRTKKNERQRAVDATRANHALLLERWSDLHGH